jgi:glycosyltransferase involved in cell wall biosynthesis
LVETIERLRSVDVEVEVLAPSYRGLKDHTHRGIPVHRFRYAPARLETLTHDQTTPDRLRERPLYAALLPGYLAAGIVAAARLARTGRFDVVHAFWPLPHGLFGLAARRTGRIPLVCTFFGVELTWVRHQLPFLAPLVRGIVRRSDAVTVISGHTAAELRAFVPGTKARVIPFGAATTPEGSAELPARDDSARRLGGFRLLFVGRLVERQGVEVLLRAIAARMAEHDLRLTVVGDGPLRPSLVRLAGELGLSGRVDFPGTVDAGSLRRHFLECDAVVLPAVQDAKGDVEGLGVVLIEALSHERPVIASASGGIPDIVIDGETGLLVEPGDPDALGGAIVRVKEDPVLARRLAATGRAHVEQNFSWDAISSELASLYRELVPAVGSEAGGDSEARPRFR